MIISRQDARKRIAAHEAHRLTEAQRRNLIEEWWSIDPTDNGWAELPQCIQEELEANPEPQFDILQKRYEPLLILALTDRTFGVQNPWLEAQLKLLGEGESVVIQGAPEAMVPCRCCGYYTLRSRGNYEICRVCLWEDDGLESPDKVSSPNHMTLREGRENFQRFGVCSRDLLEHVCPDTMRMYKGPCPSSKP